MQEKGKIILRFICSLLNFAIVQNKMKGKKYTEKWFTIRKRHNEIVKIKKKPISYISYLSTTIIIIYF